MKRVIIIMLVIIIGGAFLYADEGDFLLSEKTVGRLNDMFSKFYEVKEEFAEYSIVESDIEVYARWTIFVSEDSDLLLEKLMINGVIRYYFTVFDSEEMGYYEVTMYPSQGAFYLNFNNETNAPTAVDFSEVEGIINEMLDAFNGAKDIKIDNELRRNITENMIKELVIKEVLRRLMPGAES